MRRRFVTLDVFTQTRFAGNPLAVVLESDGLEKDAMQTIAREFNLAETVFMMPPANPGSRAMLRIFTPKAGKCRSPAIRPSARRCCWRTSTVVRSSGRSSWAR